MHSFWHNSFWNVKKDFYGYPKRVHKMILRAKKREKSGEVILNDVNL